jgi:hypothetical protein
VAASGERSISYSRSFIDIININKTQDTFDFAYGEYVAFSSFFEETTAIAEKLISGESKFTLSTGGEVDLTSQGGLVGLQLFMESLDQQKDTILGLVRLGLKTENNLWAKFQN